MVNQLRLPSPSSLQSRLLDPLTAHCLLLLLLFSYLTTVHAEANVTVDDGDSRIVYSPPGAWNRSVQMPLDYGGSHMLTQNPNATAVFSFTGVAIYFLSPLWPYRVNTAVSLDSSPASLIELVDHSRQDTGQGPETAPFRVVWSATGLANTQHTLRISVGVGQTFAILDGLIYTDPSAPNSPSTPASPSPTRIVASASSYANRLSSSPSNNRIVPIVVGTLFGILGILMLLVALWYFFRKRQRPVSEAWTVDGQTNAGEAGPNNGYPNNGYGYGYGAPPTSYGYPPLQPVQASWGAQYHQYAYGTPLPPFGMSAYSGVPPNRAPNRYQPGYTLSTITEKSTPQIGETRTMQGTPLSAAAAAFGANSPASLQSEMGYYTAPGSSVGQHSPAVGAGQLYSPESQPQPPLQRTEKSSTVQLQKVEKTQRK